MSFVHRIRCSWTRPGLPRLGVGKIVDSKFVKENELICLILPSARRNLGHGPLSHGCKHVILRMSSFPQVPSSSIIRSITCYNNQSSSKSPQTKQEKPVNGGESNKKSSYTVINRPWAKFTCDLWLGPIRKLKEVFNLDQTVCPGTWHCKVWVSLREKPSHPPSSKSSSTVGFTYSGLSLSYLSPGSDISSSGITLFRSSLRVC